MGNLARWHHIQASTRRCRATSDQTANCTEVRACGNLISSRVQSDPQGGISCRVFDYDHRLRESTVSGNLSAQGFPSSRNHGAETNMATCTSVLVAWLDSTDCAGILDKGGGILTQIAWGMVFFGALSMIISYLAELHHVEPAVCEKPVETPPAKEFAEFDDLWWKEIFDD